MSLERPVRSTLTGQIATQLEQLIQSEEWPVGSKIPPEPELVARLGVSRNTMREAVKALIHAGLLEARQGDGTYVRAKSELGAALRRRFRKSDLMETLEVRFALEQEAARLAAERRTEDDVRELSRLLADFRAAPDKIGYIQADVALHKAIIRATGNGLYIDLYEHLSDAMHASLDVNYAQVQLERHDRIHGDLVRHIIERNPDAAAEAVREHILVSQRFVATLME